MFILHELEKNSNKACTVNNTQLFQKKRVFILHELVFLLHELKKNVFLMPELVKFQTKIVL